MAIINLLRNPLKPREIERFSISGTLIDWLQGYAPAGLGGPVNAYINGVEWPIDHWDRPLKNSDMVLLAVSPGAQAVIPYIVNVLVNLAISYVVFQIFGPDVPNNPGFITEDPNTVYSLSSRQNAARVGGVIPVIYGEVLTTPDYASQPFIEFTPPQDKNFVAGIFGGPPGFQEIPVLVFNDIQTDKTMLLGNSIFTFLNVFEIHGLFRSPGGPLYTQYLYDVDYDTPGPLPPRLLHQYSFGYRFKNTNNALIELAPQGEFIQGSDLTLSNAEYKKGAGDQWLNYLLAIGQGEYDLIDVLFGDVSVSDLPDNEVQILFANPSDHNNSFGNIAAQFNSQNAGSDVFFHENVITSIEVGTQLFEEVESSSFYPLSNYYPISRIAIDISFDRGFYAYDSRGNFYSYKVGIMVQIIGPAEYVKFINWPSSGNFTPIRRTLVIDVPPGLGYKVRIKRMTPRHSETGRSQDSFRWVGLRGYGDVDPGLNTYNNTCVLALRIRASETLTKAAESRVRARVKRKTPPIENFPNTGSNPVTALVDIVTNEKYGAALSVNTLDKALLYQLLNYWGGENTVYGFNAVFNGASTIFEAIKSVLAVVGAQPLPIGGKLSVAHEGARDFPIMIFSEGNIVQNSFQLNYQFDKVGDYDSVRVQFRDPATWQVEYAYYPPQTSGQRYLEVQLFGCTNNIHATAFARFTYNKRQLLRRTVTFETELEGLIPRAGDMIGVSHSLPRWSESGQVVDWNIGSLILTVDQNLTGYGFSNDTGQLVLRGENGTDTDIIVGQLISPREILLPYAPIFPIWGAHTSTPTLYAWGEMDNTLKYFTITNIEHKGEVSVAISAVEYNALAFVGGMDYLETAL